MQDHSQHSSTSKLNAFASGAWPPHRDGESCISRIATPLLGSVWSEALSNYPDQQFASLIVQGIQTGFRVGYDHSRSRPRSAVRNMRSADEHPEVVSQYLAQECAQGRILGPFSVPPCADLCTSSFGVIPKRHQPGKWRLIMDLSTPAGYSVNDGINPELCSLSYISVDDIAVAVLRLGRGALLAKTDIKHAYRQVPVHPSDRPLLGMQWKGAYYVDTVLPFGLRSAPLIFTAIADALEWIVRQRGVEHIFHYIDDFVVLGAGDSDQCIHGLTTLIQSCESLGCLIAAEKTEGPATRLAVLGIEFDSVAMEMRLPDEKLQWIRSMLGSWKSKRTCRRKELESLVGLLQHASKVVRPGRIFLRRLYTLLSQTHQFRGHYTVRLNAECQADLEWWCLFIVSWNGVSLLHSFQARSPDVHVWSDASGSWGCGAFWQDHWFQLEWGALPIAGASIAPKEFFPIIVACLLWGELWQGKLVCFHCDNEAVVNVITRQSAKDPLLCHQLRCLFFVSASYEFEVTASHTPGVTNTAADAISRNNLRLFFAQVPSANPRPSPVPHALQVGLCVAQPQWRRQDWTKWFSSFINRP